VGSNPTLGTKYETMKVDINYISTKHFPIDKLGWWAFYFNQYTYIKGFNLRILGVHFNIRENNGTEKMINSFRNK
jgi:hypothetical protein